MRFSMGRAEASVPPAVTVVSAQTLHAVVEHPGWLEPSEYDGADLVLSFREDFSGFRPNLVLTAVESNAPLVDASIAAVLAAPSW
ncbi:hypothetical protein AB1K54_14840 [Microbacterium sp. BWT-B31]|uniref:hypothetical protein n=1 Tax=Microbacterium sp. BWT-B31 TaxID=3232072 RepID=UPI0035277EE6